MLLPQINDKEVVPDSLTLRIRRLEGSTVIWESIVLSRDELLQRVRLHPRPEVDVAAVNVLDLITDRIKDETARYMNWHSVSAEYLPGNNKIKIEVTDDAVVIGYPRGYYDEVNVFPVVKAGIVASRWGAPFNGQPYFLVDAKLFPGSSGSIVISKPRDFVVDSGQIFHAQQKQFAFLGIFSGEPYLQHSPLQFDDMTIVRKSGFNVGIVWYGYLVGEVIHDGAAITP